jgi:hypothetical protein
MDNLCFACNSIDELDKDIIIHNNKRLCKLCNNISNFYNVIIHKYTCSVYNLKHKAHKYKTKYLCKSCKYFIGSNINELTNITKSNNIQP